MDANQLRERIIERSSREENGCWTWQGYVARGYGYIDKSLAHRAAYEAFVGPIGEGLHVHHRCRNTGCVNPAHLRTIDASKHRRVHARYEQMFGRPGQQRCAYCGSWANPDDLGNNDYGLCRLCIRGSMARTAVGLPVLERNLR